MGMKTLLSLVEYSPPFPPGVYDPACELEMLKTDIALGRTVDPKHVIDLVETHYVLGTNYDLVVDELDRAEKMVKDLTDQLETVRQEVAQAQAQLKATQELEEAC